MGTSNGQKRCKEEPRRAAEQQSGATLAQLSIEFVEISLRLLLTFEKRRAKINLSGRQGLCPHCHSLHVLLKGFGLLTTSPPRILLDIFAHAVAGPPLMLYVPV